MKLRKTIIITLLITFIVSISVLAAPVKGPIFMGEVIEVKKDEQQGNLRLLVKGYIKGCEVYYEELVAIVNAETRIITNQCATAEQQVKSVEFKDLEVNEGDKVFIILSEAMTKSIPPQSVAKAIQVSKSVR